MCPEEREVEAKIRTSVIEQPYEAWKWKYLHIVYVLRPAYVFVWKKKKKRMGAGGGGREQSDVPNCRFVRITNQSF